MFPRTTIVPLVHLRGQLYGSPSQSAAHFARLSFYCNRIWIGSPKTCWLECGLALLHLKNNDQRKYHETVAILNYLCCVVPGVHAVRKSIYLQCNQSTCSAMPTLPVLCRIQVLCTARGSGDFDSANQYFVLLVSRCCNYNILDLRRHSKAKKLHRS